MTDAPKIDTQAPERIWAWEVDNDGWWDTEKPDWIEAPQEYIRADLSAAREAAAAQAMREAIVARIEAYDENARENYAAFKGLPDLEKCWAGHAEAAGQMVRAVKRLPLPDTTALDRLIAERVREAVDKALRDAVAICKKVRNENAENEDQAVGALDCAVSIMDEVNRRARGSKEGRDG